MKRYYTNQQRFQFSSTFSVAQRRFAWLLKRHPRKYYPRKDGRAACWIRIDDKPLAWFSEKEFEAMEEFSRKNFRFYAESLCALAQESHRRGLPVSK